jgi:ABC-type multidrug transport system fused ATPase/permease subunit
MFKRTLVSRSLSFIQKPLKGKGITLVLLLSLAAFLDLFSLASFLPILQFLLHKDKSESGSWWTDQLFADHNNRSDIYVLLCILLVFFLFKTLVNTWVTYKKSSFAYQVGEGLAARAMENYLSMPYAQFTSADYTREMNRICNLPLTFANNFIIPLGTLFAEGLITMMLLVAIALYDFQIFIFLLVMASPVVLIYQYNKINIQRISRSIKTLYPKLLKLALQAVEGFVEIKSFNREVYFKERYISAYRELGKVFSKDHTINTSSGRITEFIAFLCIIAIILYALIKQENNSDIIMLLGIYAGASFRILPSINRMFAAAMQMRTHEYILDDLKGFVEPSYRPTPISGITFKSIHLDHVSFEYQSKNPILHKVSLQITKGEKIAISGPSGHGKTTLLLIIKGFLKPQSGSISFDGKTIDASAVFAAYVSQSPYILDASIRENIAFGEVSENIQDEKIQSLVDALGLRTWVDSLSEGIATVIGEKGIKVSGGQRQRLAIARALYFNADILLLDEITSHLDPASTQDIVNILLSPSMKEKTIVITTHNPEVVKRFDKVFELWEKGIRAVPQNSLA